MNQPLEYPHVLFEDESLVVINKPAGWVVHEGAGETGETVVDWFVKSYPDVMQHAWPDLFRVGIVHRLDKDTSGVMVLAKSPVILEQLQAQFKERTTQKVYKALVYGEPRESKGTIETFIGRHPKRRQEQTVLPVQVGEQARREAITEYQVENSYSLSSKRRGQGEEKVSLITFKPKTGRMHQLRVHAKYLGTPILGDQTYNTKPSKRLSKELGLTRQLLHAESLTFTHPTSKKQILCKAPLPQDMQALTRY